MCAAVYPAEHRWLDGLQTLNVYALTTYANPICLSETREEIQ